MVKIAKLHIYDSILILTETGRMNNVRLYNKNTFTSLASFGKIGKGPGEIINPGPTVLDKKTGTIWINDWAKQKIVKFQIDHILKKRINTSDKYIVPPSSIYPALYFFPFNDSIMAYQTRNREYYFYCADKNGKIIDSLNIKNNTKIYPDINKKDLYYALWYHHAIHPTEKKIVIAYMFADIIVGIDYKGNILFQNQGPDMIKEPSENTRKNTSIWTYHALKADENYIYCLYLGDKSISIKREGYKVNNPNSIFVFNWEGEPIARLELEHPTMSFTLDKENNRIITYASELGEIVYYDLPEFE